MIPIHQEKAFTLPTNEGTRHGCNCKKGKRPLLALKTPLASSLHFVFVIAIAELLTENPPWDFLRLGYLQHHSAFRLRHCYG